MLTKPKFGDRCNGCGLCCAAELCEVAEMAFVGASAPCPALEWEDERAWCGMIRHPSRHLQLNYTGADLMVSELYAQGVAAGQGCGMPDDIFLLDKEKEMTVARRKDLTPMGAKTDCQP